MGGNAASRSVIDIETATQRLGYAEVAKIEEGFARLAVGGRLRRSEFRTGFLNSIAGAPVPEAFASALFDGFDTTASGSITVQEFVCALAIIRKGTPEERLKLLFSVYDADRDKRLSDRDLERFAQALQDGRAGATREKAVDDALQALSAKGSAVGFERFAHWAQRNMDSPLIDWVFDIEQKLESELRASATGSVASGSRSMLDRMVPLERSLSADGREEERELLELSQVLDVEVSVTRDLRAAWRAIVAASRLGVVDLEAFLRELRSLPKDLATRLFIAFDTSGSGTLSIQEWSQGFGLCLAGSSPGRAAERAALCRRIFADEVAEVDASLVGALVAQPPSSAGGGASLVLPPEGCRELRRYADAWSVNAGGLAASESLPAAGDMGGGSTPQGGVTVEDLMKKPWFAKVDTVVRCMGYLARVDLSLQPRDPREERRAVDWFNAKFDPENPGNVGDAWYVLPARWWQLWCESTGPEAKHRRTHVLSIDNSCLVDDHSSLRIGLCHRVDYELVTEGAWRALQAWYGGPGPPLPRTVVELDGRRELEMYPLRVRVNRTDDAGEVLLLDKALEVSRAKTVGEVKMLSCALHGLEGPVSLFHRSSLNVDWEEADETKTLHELGFIDGHRLLLQKIGKLHTVMAVSPSGVRSPRTSRGVLAAVGLQNLGNTCYMNASLQCLLHTPLLARYFNVEYRFDVNTDGGWGMGGKLAVAFAELLADVESAKANGTGVIAPRGFRRTIGDFQPQFAGWKQQDAQEFLSVFMAGLSEDVNRTRQKPYVELQDSEGRPDADVAREYWSAHCRRERSVVAALFSGQFKSVLRCTVCGHENASFDPFSFLPIPLPVHDFRWVTCSVVSVPRAGALDQHTMQVCARVPKLGSVADLLEAVAGLLGFAAVDLVATEVAEGYVFRRLEDKHLLSLLGDDARPMVFHAPTSCVMSPSATRRHQQQQQQEDSPTSPRHLLAVPGEASHDAGPRTGGYPNMDTSGEEAAHGLPACSPRSSVGDETAEVVVYLVNRRLCKVQRYFLNPYKSELFGAPAVLRVPAACDVEALYSAAFRLVWQFVPDYHAAGGRWPFTLSAVKRDGSACSRCSWRRGCLGCKVLSEGAAEPVSLRDGDTLGIDWDAEVLEKQYKMKIAAHVHVHESVELAQIERKSPHRLHQSLESLVKEEELTAYCRECTKTAGDYTEVKHTKALRIWAGGPLLVLQLKRFHSKDGASYKLHNLVTFPTTLDLKEFLATSEEQAKRPSEEEMETPDPERSQGLPLPPPPPPPSSASATCVAATEAGSATADNEEDGAVFREENSDEDNALISEPATKILRGNELPQLTSAHDGSANRATEAETDEANSRTLSRDVTSYELYSVVNHIGGGMGSGHYTAFVRGGPLAPVPPLPHDGESRASGRKGAFSQASHKWYCCDDDRVYEISEEDVVTASAYLLFYVRADVAAGEVGLHDVFPTRSSETAAVDVEKVKSKPWARQLRGSGGAEGGGRTASAATIGSSGFCGVM